MSGHVPSGPARRSRLGQHFLGSARLASQLVADAGVTGDDRVVELGAGRGTLTDALAGRAAQVLAVELDPKLVSILARRYAFARNVTVLRADARQAPLPANPYRVVANLPFGVTGAVLRRLFDAPVSGLQRADLILQWQVARARAHAADGPPTDLLAARWGPWWEFRRGRRLPATCFRPRPSVDAAVLVVTRRDPPLLPTAVNRRYEAFVSRAFRSRHDAHTVGVAQWVELFQAFDRRNAKG
ncbi:MAG TPA: rRNA adenine N(6)-methyltransferase family protein [Acidimicrobiia bacterium]|nr:rRNA adenine N(6)-methyltransferase family protein [Acidimicrobiia bacterium]